MEYNKGHKSRPSRRVSQAMQRQKPEARQAGSATNMPFRPLPRPPLRLHTDDSSKKKPKAKTCPTVHVHRHQYHPHQHPPSCRMTERRWREAHSPRLSSSSQTIRACHGPGWTTSGCSKLMMAANTTLTLLSSGGFLWYGPPHTIFFLNLFLRKVHSPTCREGAVRI